MKCRVNKVFLIPIASLFILSIGCINEDDNCSFNPTFNIDRDQLANDLIKIDDYLDENNLVAQTDPSGIRYTVLRKGEGSSPVLCNSVTIIYEGKILETDEIFFESESPTVSSLTDLIPGFQVGIPKVNSGGRIILYIPSGLGYGKEGLGEIVPPNAILILDVTVENIN